MNAKQVIDFRPSKGITTAQSAEHQRNWSEKGWKWATDHGNYDRSREHLNFEIVRGGKIQAIDKSISIPRRMAENLAARGIKDPNAGRKEPHTRTIVNFILGGSRERMYELAFCNQKVNLDKGADNSAITRQPDIENWALDMYRHVCEQWGEDNIIGFYVHLDEQNPHIHCTLMPISAENKFAFAEIFCGKDRMDYRDRTRAMHDAFAKVNERWGLYRGDNIYETGARHRSTEEYRRSLSHDCTSLEQQISAAQQQLQALYADIRLAERRVKGLKTMVGKLHLNRADLLAQIEKLCNDIKTGQGDPADLQKQIDKLKSELNTVETKLTDKQKKLDDAATELDSLNAELTNLREATTRMHEQGLKAANQMHNEVRSLLASAVLNELLNDFRMRLPQLSMYDRDMFSGSMLMDLADSGDNIFKCAVLLFAGYVDGATTFAQGSGGGGSCSGDWGRKPDEDDREWARRCMLQACRMMRPSPRTRHR